MYTVFVFTQDIVEDGTLWSLDYPILTKKPEFIHPIFNISLDETVNIHQVYERTVSISISKLRKNFLRKLTEEERKEKIVGYSYKVYAMFKS